MGYLLNGRHLEEVDTFYYLGANLFATEIKTRLAVAASAMTKTSKTCRCASSRGLVVRIMSSELEGRGFDSHQSQWDFSAKGRLLPRLGMLCA